MFKALICGVSPITSTYDDANNYVTGMGNRPVLVGNDDQAIVVDSFTSASNAKRINGHSDTIVVNNIGNYVANETYAFGISYCQETIGPHWFFMQDNDVTVYNGDYAVYLIGWSRGSVTDNTLIAYGNTTQTGDDAVEAPDEVTVEDNN